jgi:hypothetical protein
VNLSRLYDVVHYFYNNGSGLELLIRIHAKSQKSVDEPSALSMKISEASKHHSQDAIPSSGFTVTKLGVNIVSDLYHFRKRSKTEVSGRTKLFNFNSSNNQATEDSKETKNSEEQENVKIRSAPKSVFVASDNQKRSSLSQVEKSGLDKLIEQDLKSTQQTRLIRQELVESSQDKHLFEFVVVVKLQEKKGNMQPFISYSFPPANVQKKENKNLMQSIPSFCFPDMDAIQPIEKLDRDTYSFVLTDIDGSRRHGYCRRMLPKGEGKRWPETYCIISSHPCFGLFSQLLDYVEQRNAKSSVAVFSFLKSVLANAFPKPGSTVSISVQDPTTGEPQEVKLTRPYASDPMLEYIDFNPLFDRLSISHILSVFVSILLERRIIFFAKDIYILSSVVHACMAMIYPFAWQHVFIPVLPKSLLDYVCSPVPFIVGVLSIHRHLVEEMPMEEVVFVDLDKDKIQGGDDTKLLPSNNLAKRLESIKKQNTSKIQNQIVADAFLDFFLEHFAEYRKYLIHKEDDYDFDMKSFLNHKNKKERKFFDLFHQSQMFERWSFELGQLEKKDSR